VPQNRERAFLIGAPDGAPFGILAPTHRSVSPDGQSELELECPLEPFHTAWDALWDLEHADSPELGLRGKWADLLPSVPEGSNYLYFTDRGDGLPLFGWRRRYWNFLLKLAKDQPSWTLTAHPGPASRWRYSSRLSENALFEGRSLHPVLPPRRLRRSRRLPPSLHRALGVSIRPHRLVGSPQALCRTPEQPGPLGSALVAGRNADLF
jgi:hypothetical protein